MSIVPQPYNAVFLIGYDVYFNALSENKAPKGARLMSDRMFKYVRSFNALCRRDAVNKACQWYWKHYKSKWGQANQIMIIEDPYDEVRYSEEFSCSDKANRYLSEQTLESLIQDSNGELIKEEEEGCKNHPTNSVKRVKRRRKYHERIGVNLYKSPSTETLFYVTTDRKNGKRIRHSHKLASKDVDKAINEIERRFSK
jgi:hypothetical protein